MSHREFNAQRTMLANAMATAGAELREYMNVGSALAAIPNTEPPKYVVAGTLQMIAKLLPSVDAAPAVQAPSQVPAELTDELIKEMAIMACVDATRMSTVLDLARSIERFVRAGSSDVRDKALEEAAKVCDNVCKEYQGHARRRGIDDDEFYDAYLNKSLASSECAYVIRGLKSEAPAASKEGGEHA
jgi:hypothetical protein